MADNYIILKITAKEDHLKVVWSDKHGASFAPYSIYRKQVENVAKKCRSILKELGMTLPFRATSQYNLKYAPILAKLAEEGSKLHYLLFDGSASGRETTKQVQKWLKKFKGSTTQLTISADASCHIPWTLLFEEEEKTSKNTTMFDGFANFWALKYSISILYSGMSPKNLNQARSAQSFRLLSAMDREELNKAVEFLGPEKEKLLELVRKPVGTAFSSEGCKKKWSEVGANECLIHFFCHADGGELKFSDEDKMGVIDFRQTFSRKDSMTESESYCLVFLNGCSTADGDLDNGFLSISSDPGFCGFIGAEAALPSEFAIGFGMDFLHLFLEKGWSLQEIIDHLYRQHWPLGLLYGCYGNPDFRVEVATKSS